MTLEVFVLAEWVAKVLILAGAPDELAWMCGGLGAVAVAPGGVDRPT